MKEVHILKSLEEINTVSDPIRLKILLSLGDKPKTAQNLSDALGVSRSKIHYHLKILQENGIVEVVDTELINGITQKYFLPVAKAFIPDNEIFNKNIRQEVFDFKISGKKYDLFKQELDELIEKYKSEDRQEESLQLQIYKIKK